MPALARISAVAVVASLAAACASPSRAPMASVPEAVRVPSSDRLRMETVGVGELTYECRPKRDAAGQFEWAFAGPVATLYDRNRMAVGKYYGGPTWESNDGSKVTGTQVAVAPSETPKSIPLQLVKANPATGSGAMQGVTYIQRLNTQGGVAPDAPCGAANAGAKMQVPYQADYLFYGS